MLSTVGEAGGVEERDRGGVGVGASTPTAVTGGAAAARRGCRSRASSVSSASAGPRFCGRVADDDDAVEVAGWPLSGWSSVSLPTFVEAGCPPITSWRAERRSRAACSVVRIRGRRRRIGVPARSPARASTSGRLADHRDLASWPRSARSAASMSVGDAVRRGRRARPPRPGGRRAVADQRRVDPVGEVVAPAELALELVGSAAGVGRGRA